MGARLSLLLLFGFLGAWIASFALRGEVVAPHSNRLELLLEEAPSDHPSSRRHSDYSSYYAPEIGLHAEAFALGELALWNEHVQLGRPASHLAGVSPAYPPMAACLLVARDPHVAHTLLWSLTVLLAAAFAWSWFAELGLGPSARLVGALLVAGSPFVAYWAPLLLFTSTICWTVGALWLAEAWTRRPSAARWLGLATCIWLLLASGYPQQVVWHLVVVLVALAPRLARREGLVQRLAGWSSAAACGVLLAAPILADTALAASRSGRAQLGDDFYLAAIPALDALGEWWSQLLQWIDPRLAGDPWSGAREGEAARFNGVAFGVAGPCLVAAACCVRGARRHAALACLLLLLAVVPALFAPLLRLPAFTLSRFTPAAVALLPLAAAAACVVEHVSRRRPAAPRDAATRLATWFPVALAALVVAAWWSTRDARVPGADATRLAATVLVALVVAWGAWSGRAAALAGCVAASAVLAACPLLLTQPRASIAGDSPLCASLREACGPDGRYAIVAERNLRILPPNQEALLGLSSVHSYDSLSSRDYQEWCARLSRGGAEIAGRWFRRFDDPALLDPRALAQAGVVVLASSVPLAGIAEPMSARHGPLTLWRLREPAWVPGVLAPEALVEPSARADARTTRAARPMPAAGGDDAWTFAPAAPGSLFFAARQHHPDWRATARKGGLEFELEPTRVDGLHLGFALPAGAESIELRFEPWARRAWIPPLVVGLAAALLVARQLLRRRNSTLGGSPLTGTGS